MAYIDQLTEKVNAVREAAWEARRREWLLSIPTKAAPGMVPEDPVSGWTEVECDFGADLSPRLERFWTFADGEPAAFQAIIERLSADGVAGGEGARPLSDIEGGHTVADNIVLAKNADIAAAIERMDGWHGAPADFMAVLKGRYTGEAGVARYQLAFVAELGYIAKAYREVLVRMREDIDTIAEKTTEALDGLYAGHNAIDTGSAVELVFKVAGAVAAATKTEPWVGAAITLGEYLTGLIDAAPEGGTVDDGPWNIGGGTVEETLATMDAAITRLHDLIVEQENSIKRALDQDIGLIGGAAIRSFQLDAGLSDAPQDYAAPDTDDRSTIHVVYADLYFAGYVDLSAAAFHYQAAAQLLGDLSALEGGAFGTWFGYSVGAWRSLCDTLRHDILQQTSEYFAEKGEALCKAATAYAERDDAVAARFRRMTAPGSDRLDELERQTTSQNELRSDPTWSVHHAIHDDGG
jgi:hypothetical protein